ncbi:hypothetical protein [Mucilaginibacter pedocola]|nr:hypothetical protein [Mucilaginibacter pedocola]
MRNLSLLIIIVALGLSACKKEEVVTGYDDSYAAWQSFKKSSNNSYSYVTYYGSWTGIYAESKITVLNGKVVGRDFFRTRTTAVPMVADTITKWTESGVTLNTHDDGFETLTLDQIYTKAKTELLNVSRAQNEVVFRADNNGIVSAAGFIPNNCADDCFTGVYIKNVKVYVKSI